MSPEQRAEKALEFIGWGCGLDACKEPDRPSCGCKAYLALAFKETEDAAYERAAQACAKQAPEWVKKETGDYWDGYRHALDDAKDDILALKSQEP